MNFKFCLNDQSDENNKNGNATHGRRIAVRPLSTTDILIAITN
jgi:hypothetical protein